MRVIVRFRLNPREGSQSTPSPRLSGLDRPTKRRQDAHAPMEVLLTASSPDVLIRELQDSDSLEALTALLHRAYKRLLDMGLRYWATHQTVDDTRTRIAGGKCLVAVLNGRIVGTVTYQYPPRWQGTPWYTRADVACISQFAVEPDCQRRGIGSALMTRVETMATDDGAAELALSTAEPAAHLIDYYARRGYRFVEHTDATLPHYRSVILSKRLVERTPGEIASARIGRMG